MAEQVKVFYFVGSLVLSMLFSATPTDVFAKEDVNDSCENGFVSVHIDQDLFLEFFPLVDKFPQAFTENQDRDYTMGVEFSAASCPDSNNPLSFFTPQQMLSNWFLDSVEHKKTYVTSIGFNAYTPDQLNTAEVVPSDRPYASILYLTNSYALSAEDGNSALETSISIGVLGLGFGDKAQTWIHKQSRENTGLPTPYAPLGWHNQVADGGQPTAMVKIVKYQRLFPDILANNKHFDIVASFAGNVGYNTGAAVGVMSRFGFFRQNRPVETVVRQGGFQYANTNEPSATSSNWEVYGFAGIRARAVIYNALLQGQFGRDPHALTQSQLRNFVYDYTTGVGLTYKKAEFQFYCSTHSSEHFLPTQRSHSWCGSNLLFGF
jgi:hypothetical protein